MLPRSDRRPADIAADVAAAVAPYTTRLAHDRELRTRLADALRASVTALKRARRHTGTSGLVWALASDPVLKRQITEAIVDIQVVKRRIDRSRRRRARVVTGVVGFAALVALALPFIRRSASGSPPGDAAGTEGGNGAR
jgi:hypothetical protein